jgi:hypothetical protein
LYASLALSVDARVRAAFDAIIADIHRRGA